MCRSGNDCDVFTGRKELVSYSFDRKILCLPLCTQVGIGIASPVKNQKSLPNDAPIRKSSAGLAVLARPWSAAEH